MNRTLAVSSLTSKKLAVQIWCLKASETESRSNNWELRKSWARVCCLGTPKQTYTKIESMLSKQKLISSTRQFQSKGLQKNHHHLWNVTWVLVKVAVAGRVVRAKRERPSKSGWMKLKTKLWNCPRKRCQSNIIISSWRWILKKKKNLQLFKNEKRWKESAKDLREWRSFYKDRRVWMWKHSI